MVNSSLFGLSRDVSDLGQALALLGCKPLKLLVLGFSLPGELFMGLSGETLGRYWRRALTKAVAAREFSQSVWHLPGDEAFIAGLLQNLGMLLLIQELGQPYVRFLAKVYAAGEDPVVLEMQSLGFTHTQLSGRLLAHWGLPHSLVEAVGWDTLQHDPYELPASRRTLPQILHLAELVARLLVDGQRAVLGDLLRVGQHYRDLSSAQLEALVATLEEKVAQLANVLALHLPAGVNYQDVLVHSQMQLAELAASAAGDLLRSQVRQSPLDESIAQEVEMLAEAAGALNSAAGRPAPAAPRSVPAPAPAAPCEDAALAAQPGNCAVAQREPEDRALDPGLLYRLDAAVAACRLRRCA